MANQTTSGIQLDFGDRKVLDSQLSERIRGLVGSEILKIASDVRAMIAAGESVCNLTVGDFDASQFPIPQVLRDHVVRAYDEGHTNYPPSDGVLLLREAVADFVAREWGVTYPVESILIAGGARPILYSAYRAVIEPGDVAVYPVPSWNNNHYVWMTRAQGVPVVTSPDNGFMPTLDLLEPHLGEARVVCINSPLNPTGTVIDESTLRDLCTAIVDENRRRLRDGRRALFLIHDQVYASLVFGDARHHLPAALVPEVARWTISLDGISKSLAATGLRVGWVLAAPAVTARMKSFVGHVGAWAPRPEQIAVARFLADPAAVAAFRRDMDGRVRQRLTALFDGFETMRSDGYPVRCISPQGAIYLSLQLDLVGRTVDGRPIDSNEAIRRLLLDDAGLAVVPFQAFGLEDDSGWFRLSVGAVSMADIEGAFPRLRAVLDRVE